MNLYVYTGNDPVNWIDPWGLDAVSTGLTVIGWGIAIAEPTPAGEVAMTAITAAKIAKGVKDAAEECEDDEPCDPPEGTRCYEGPDYGKPHGGLSPHYHIYEMQKKRSNNQCFWRYLGGKVGVGVVATPSAGMKKCSSYSNFTGRKGR